MCVCASGKSGKGFQGRADRTLLQIHVKSCHGYLAHGLKLHTDTFKPLPVWVDGLCLRDMTWTIPRPLMNWVVVLIKSSMLRQVVWQFPLIYCACDIWAWFIVLTYIIVFGQSPCIFWLWFHSGLEDSQAVSMEDFILLWLRFPLLAWLFLGRMVNSWVIL